MDAQELVDLYPNLYHMANAGSWDAIREHGLWTTEQIVRSSGLPPAVQDEILFERRAHSVEIDHPQLGLLHVRDQAPLRTQFLTLEDLTIEEWLEVLNNRVFFWLHPDKLSQLLGARLYRNREQDVITLDTASVVAAHGADIRLSPINSGATLYPNASSRGSATFHEIEDYPYAQRRRGRSTAGAIVELAVIGGVHDIGEHLVSVERWRGQEFLGRL